MKIWIDADACPKMVKEVIFKASFRLKVPVVLVANSYMAVPPGGLISSIQVEKGADIADFYIVENVSEKDLVITADIPLAALVVEKDATAINPRGELYTAENVRERLSMRDFMKDLRDSGVDTGGPQAFGLKDKERFANSLNRILTKMMK
ncbi:MAG: YaiI/YqxD family protein [Epsilonproteobacteria bacterium]|nr:MAG: YaiI/YqxD family protein [Campylobacterota bacterium]